jgi:hypothetical protein
LPIGIRTDGLVIDLVARSEPVDIGKIASLHDSRRSRRTTSVLTQIVEIIDGNY